jgi:inner membrane transporter RhtA
VIPPSPRPPTPARDQRRAAGTATLLVLVIGFSIQTGSAIAVRVIASVGIVEALWLRTAVAAILLLIVRPRSLRLPKGRDRISIAAVIVALLAMNLSFYGAITHASVGIVVAIEFLGPLAIAVIGTRRAIDLIWIVLAGGGVALLAGPSSSVSGLGLALSLVAAASWAAYLLLAKRAVSNMDPLAVTTLMLVGSSLLLTPVLLIDGFQITGHSSALALGALVALLSSAFPYFLEMVALRMVRASLYGVLLSIEPAIAALAGWIILSQDLSVIEITAMVAVMAAAAGASWTAGAPALETPSG